MPGETDEQKSEQSAFANLAVGAISAFFGVVFVAAVDLLSAPIFQLLPVWLTAIIAVSLVIALPYLGLVMVRLGGCSVGSEHRDWYESFRFGLLTDNYNGRYAIGMGKAIDAIDRFFGDASDVTDMDKAKPRALGIFPKAFGLKMPAPLWTAASYDRSLLLALTYPLMAMLLFWTIWGGASVGQAEAAIGLDIQPEGWKRAVGCAATISSALVFWQFNKSESPWAGGALFFAAVALLSLGSFHAGSGAVAVAFAGAAAAYVAGPGTGTGTGAVAGAVAIACTATGPGVDSFAAFITVVFTTVITVFAVMKIATKKGLVGPILLSLSILSTMTLLSAPKILFDPSFKTTITLLYFIALLTLVNGPFDWVALGITRGLMRRGQQSGGFTPIITALIDLALSLALMAMLAFATLWATELYNHSAISGGGRAVIDVPTYLAAMNDPAQRSDPKYFWLYAMLFSSQIPAIANFAFSALCLLRGAPFINRKIAQMLPESGGIGSWQRLGVSSLAAGQMAIAVAIGLSLYYVLVVGVIAIIDPLFGDGLVSILAAAQITPLLE